MSAHKHETKDETRKNGERLQLILATIPIATYTAPIDPGIDTAWISGDVEKLTGFSVAEYMSRKDFWRKRLHPEDRPRVLDMYKNPVSGDEIILEYRWLCKDGNYKWFYDRAIKKRNDSVVEYFGIILDITARKRMELALEAERERLQKALDEVRTLRGIIPICVSCKQIRDDKGYWNQVEKYVGDHTEAEFSHGICPECMEKLYPQFAKKKRKIKNGGTHG